MGTQNNKQSLSLDDIKASAKSKDDKATLVPSPIPNLAAPIKKTEDDKIISNSSPFSPTNNGNVIDGITAEELLEVANKVEEKQKQKKTDVDTEEDKIVNDNDREAVDVSIEEDEAAVKEVKTLTEKLTPQVQPSGLDDEMDKVFEEAMEEEAAEAHKLAEDEAKEKSDELLNDDNLELDDDAIYERKQAEIRAKQREEETRKRWLELQSSFTKLMIEPNIADIKSYKISKRPVSINKIFNQDLSNSKIASWGLYYSGIPLTMSEVSGPELGLIIPNNDNETIDQIQMFNIIHKHIVDPNKGTLEDFLKKFSFLDFSDILFTMYKATFKDSNFTYFTCPNNKCNKVFMEKMNIEDMIVYPNKETEDRMKKIIAKDPTTKSMVTNGMVAVSPDIVVSIKVPSIYKVLFEQQYISQSFKDKNRDMNNTILYIDEIYFKDPSTKTISPFDTRPDPNDIQKTAQRRVAIFSRILNRLKLEEYIYLTQRIRDYLEKYPDNKITYQFPSVKCPDCGTEIPAQAMDPYQMVFYRRQLGRIVLSITRES